MRQPDFRHATVYDKDQFLKMRIDPGVESAGTADMPVLSGGGWVAPMIVIAGYRPKPGEDMTAHVNAVSPGYFKTLGIHLLAGRVFLDSDTATSQSVAVVNQSFVKRFFGNERAVGKFVGKGNDPSAPADTEIVGVVNDTDYESLRNAAPRQIFLCVAQHSLGFIVYVRTKRDPRAAFSSIRKLVREMDPRIPMMRELVLLVAIGIAVALPFIFVLNRLVRSELYGIALNDVSSILVAILILSSVAFLAGYIRSRRAASSDPMQVLRYE